MSTQSLTITLPQSVYERIQQASQKSKKPINDLIVEVVSAAAPVIDGSSANMRSSLAQMAFLNDAALWQAARTTLPIEFSQRLEDLHHKEQSDGLTADERAEEQNLLRLYRETLLVRAQAAVLLAQRNYDVSDPSQFNM